jgi:hypothetical protein
LVVGAEVTDARSWPMPRGLIAETLTVGGLFGRTQRAEGGRFAEQVRFVEGAANPAAATMLLQTMAVQMQLKQIQETLEDIDEKLDTLLKPEQHGVLAEVIATGQAVEELDEKVWAGHRLTDADEVKLRDYQDVVRTQRLVRCSRR